ncbi:hypothetical protein [Desmospora profundinema]|uniref:Uncharacterized protein n=1 Tax=Desmospora profundinema TaxID=1571184 RepID=A0ABU1IHQ5_9BACL|nr:hypothetical protein [Desmospora profundinema]MDR6224077.1 hypothetical protein [Desmospora profundinema]
MNREAFYYPYRWGTNFHAYTENKTSPGKYIYGHQVTRVRQRQKT